MERDFETCSSSNTIVRQSGIQDSYVQECVQESVQRHDQGKEQELVVMNEQDEKDPHVLGQTKVQEEDWAEVNMNNEDHKVQNE